MIAAPTPDAVREGLKLAVTALASRPAQRDKARALLDRLNTPVRIMVMGLPGSGKSQVMNILAGQSLFDEMPHPTLVDVAYGPRARILVDPDKPDPIEIEGLALDDPRLAGAQSLRIEAPIAVLEKVRLTEMRIEGPRTVQTRNMAWAAKRADIAIWCSTRFGRDEQAMWRLMPDHLKDHGCLALGKADILYRDGILGDLMAALELIVAEEFHSLLPLAGKQASAAIGKTDPDSEDALFASGGKALADTVLKMAEQGRQADLDNAWVFLQRFAHEVQEAREAAAAAPEPASQPAPEPVQYQPEPEPEPEPAPAPVQEQPEPVAEPEPEPVQHRPDPAPRSKPVTEIIAARPRSRPLPPPDPARIEILEEISEELRVHAMQIEAELDQGGDASVRSALASCCEVTENLLMRVSEGAPASADLDALVDDLADAADMMVLFQQEGDENALADAVALLLQLRRDSQILRAA
ncbi:hypothetical protein [Actibacterium sp. XHP0104]|uniref:hypothetical protein n=1 Tax=Actibacterium sp. XHP0104 TaxID=2984335 RepID=UPI0021E91414|nr:hypothetical protein [Actibacterium sp. XHP0104]MCV2882961.1 hypothetical protein [Actibacterium sp. XHP0104]